VGLAPLAALGVVGREDVVRPGELDAPTAKGDRRSAGGRIHHALEARADALDHRRRVRRQCGQREVRHLELARVHRILADEMALRVARHRPTGRQGQLDVAAVENEHALEAEGIQPLALAHWMTIVSPNGDQGLEADPFRTPGRAERTGRP